MEIDKINTQVIKVLEDNEDLFTAFKELSQLGRENKIMEGGNKLIELVNILCKKSKRIIFENPIREEHTRPRKVGININGLGIIHSWSSQLSSLGTHSYYNTDDEKNLLEIFNNDLLFDELIKAINKHNVKNLKKLRKHFLLNQLKGNEIVFDDKKLDISIKENDEEFLIEITKNGYVNNLHLKSKSNNNYPDIREVGEILRTKDIKDLFYNEDLDIMKEFSSKIVDMNLKNLKVLVLLFKHKKHIKNRIAENIKILKQEVKNNEKKDKFVLDILNPIKAVDNL